MIPELRLVEGVQSPTLATSLRSSLRDRVQSRNSDGFVLVFCTMFITVLITMGGFAVDVGNWYYHIQRMQRAADAAALAGSIYLPGDFTDAKATAATSLSTNGLAADNYTVTQLAAHPTEVQVTVTEKVKSLFVEIIGINSFNFTRGAVAEYRPYVPMGSPSNLLGTEPSAADAWEKTQDVGLQDHYWLNISAAGTAKSNGDRYSGGLCDSSTDGCNTSVAAPYGNIDYNPDGQIFIVRLKAGTSGNLAIQAFDPEFAYVGDQCDATTLDDGTNPAYGSNTGMYTWGNANPYCTGDNMTDTTKTPPATTMQLFSPATSAGGSQPISLTGCTAQTYPGYKGNIMAKVNPASPSYDAGFTSYFRKWTTVCNLYIGSNHPAGDYLLHVYNSTSTAFNGLNRYALRAAMLTTGGTVDASNTQNVALFSQGRLVIYAHDQTGDVTFFIAQVHSGAAGEALNVTLFDIGDATGGANLSFLPPLDAKSGGAPLTSFSGCQYTPPDSNVYQPMSANCSVNGLTSTIYNGRVVNLKVQLPGDYACNDNSTDGCWTRLKLHYGAGSVTDTTSWEVTLDGNPVHLLSNAG